MADSPTITSIEREMSSFMASLVTVKAQKKELDSEEDRLLEKIFECVKLLKERLPEEIVTEDDEVKLRKVVEDFKMKDDGSTAEVWNPRVSNAPALTKGSMRMLKYSLSSALTFNKRLEKKGYCSPEPEFHDVTATPAVPPSISHSLASSDTPTYSTANPTDDTPPTTPITATTTATELFTDTAPTSAASVAHSPPKVASPPLTAVSTPLTTASPSPTFAAPHPTEASPPPTVASSPPTIAPASPTVAPPSSSVVPPPTVTTAPATVIASPLTFVASPTIATPPPIVADATIPTQVIGTDSPSRPRKFKKDDLVFAKWSEDGTWYTAVVVDCVPRKNKNKGNRYMVTFLDYGNSAKVNELDMANSVLDISGNEPLDQHVYSILEKTLETREKENQDQSVGPLELDTGSNWDRAATLEETSESAAAVEPCPAAAIQPFTQTTEAPNQHPAEVPPCSYPDNQERVCSKMSDGTEDKGGVGGVAGSPPIDLVYAKCPDDETWCRAEILEVVDDEFKVLFIDYGTTDFVSGGDVVWRIDEIPRGAKLDSLLLRETQQQPMTVQEADSDEVRSSVETQQLEATTESDSTLTANPRSDRGKPDFQPIDIDELETKEPEKEFNLKNFLDFHSESIKKRGGMSNTELGTLYESLEKFKRGDICSAYHRFGRVWVDATVLSVHFDGVRVNFIDGFREIVHPKYLVLKSKNLTDISNVSTPKSSSRVPISAEVSTRPQPCFQSSPIGIHQAVAKELDSIQVCEAREDSDGGGARSGGAASGGTNIAGASSGGASSGGATSGGASIGGASSGGASSGGASSGGSNVSSASSSDASTGSRTCSTSPHLFDLRELVAGQADEPPVLNAVTMFTKAGANFSNPESIALAHKSDNILIARRKANCVSVVTSEGEFIRDLEVTGGLEKPAQVCPLSVRGGYLVRDKAGLHCFDDDYNHVQSTCTISGREAVCEDPDTGNILLLLKKKKRQTDNGYTYLIHLLVIDQNSLGLERKIDISSFVKNHELTSCKSMACSRGRVYLVDAGLDCIYIINLETGDLVAEVGKRGRKQGEFNNPAGIVVDEFGNFLVADSRNHRIQLINIDGNFGGILESDTEIKKPSGLALSRATGELFVISSSEGSLTKCCLGQPVDN